jgi:uncharacterized membrane protein YqjE
LAEIPETPVEITSTRGPVSGLFKSLTNLVSTLVAIVQTRLELFTTELQEEVHRVAELLVWTLIALFAAGMGLVMASLAIIFVFWDTHRVLATVGVTAAFFSLAAIALLVMRTKVRTKPPMLDATLAELAKDRDQLRSRL